MTVAEIAYMRIIAEKAKEVSPDNPYIDILTRMIDIQCAVICGSEKQIDVVNQMLDEDD